MARTLVIHPGALGDVLLALPALRALRRRAPGNELVLAAQSHLGSLVRDLGEIDGHVRFDALGLDALFADGGHPAGLLALAPLDHAVCWFGASDPDFAPRFCEIVPSSVVAPSVPKVGTVWKHLVATATGEATQHGEAIAESRSEALSRDRAFVRVSPALVDDCRRALETAGWNGERPLLFVHPGAGGPAKRWPVDGFARVLERLSGRFTIAVHEGPTDGEAARGLMARLDSPIAHLDNPSLPVLAGALVHADGYLGNDSGVSHLAAAVGVPSVVLFRRDLLAWAPWAPGVEIVTVSTDDVSESDEQRVTAALGRMCARDACPTP